MQVQSPSWQHHFANNHTNNPSPARIDPLNQNNRTKFLLQNTNIVCHHYSQIKSSYYITINIPNSQLDIPSTKFVIVLLCFDHHRFPNSSKSMATTFSYQTSKTTCKTSPTPLAYHHQTHHKQTHSNHPQATQRCPKTTPCLEHTLMAPCTIHNTKYNA